MKINQSTITTGLSDKVNSLFGMLIGMSYLVCEAQIMPQPATLKCAQRRHSLVCSINWLNSIRFPATPIREASLDHPV